MSGRTGQVWVLPVVLTVALRTTSGLQGTPAVSSIGTEKPGLRCQAGSAVVSMQFGATACPTSGSQGRAGPWLIGTESSGSRSRAGPTTYCMRSGEPLLMMFGPQALQD